jgi:ATP-dependent Clp protease adaptor protein ClpS
MFFMAHDESSAPQPPTSTATKPAESPSKVDQLPPFRVLLHNDDVNAIDDVVEWLVEVTPLGAPAAMRVTMEAQLRGLALVMVAHRERAEFYTDRLRSKGLTATFEAAT